MSATSRPRWLPTLLSVASLACSGEATTAGFEEPLRVEGGQFRDGTLPGLPPLTADDVIAGTPPTRPNVGSISFSGGVVKQGEPGRKISGLASDDAAAIGVRWEGFGSGYWLVPTLNRDGINPDDVEWRFTANFGHDLEPGLHRLLFAAVDAEGRSGTQGALRICVSPEIPDNGNACDPTASPPELVVSLGWDAPVDLDLRVITPSGKVVDSKHASSAIEDEDGDYDPTGDGVGVLDADGYAHCRPEGRRRENLVFQTTPPPGTYLIYANLFDACGQDAVRFNASLTVAAPGDAPDTFVSKQTFSQPGELQAVHANGGARLGTFLTSFNVN